MIGPARSLNISVNFPDQIRRISRNVPELFWNFSGSRSTPRTAHRAPRTLFDFFVNIWEFPSRGVVVRRAPRPGNLQPTGHASQPSQHTHASQATLASQASQANEAGRASQADKLNTGKTRKNKEKQRKTRKNRKN